MRSSQDRKATIPPTCKARWLPGPHWQAMALSTLLCACGGGGSPGPSSFTVGGTVSGLNGAPLSSADALVLSNNAAENANITTNGSFAFATKLNTGSAYAVTVSRSPTVQRCSVAGGTGSVASADISTVGVACVAATFGTLHSFSGSTTDGGRPTGALIQATDGHFYGMTYTGGAYDEGTVYKLAADGTFTLLHSFIWGDTDIGYEPEGSLIQAKDGNFYGVTYLGGPTGFGTVFKLTPDGKATPLFSSTEVNFPGRYFSSSLIQASDGNFYGMTREGGGGALGCGTVYKLTADGVATALHDFDCSATDGGSPFGSLVQARDGNLYGTTSRGGTSDDGTVFKLGLDGTFTLLHSFGGGVTDGYSPEGSLIQASDGNLYGTTAFGGASDAGTVFKITPTGSFSLVYSFDGGAVGGQYPGASLVQASDGNLYGVTGRGGANDRGAVFRLTAEGAFTLLHSFDGLSANDGFRSFGLLQARDGGLYGVSAGHPNEPGFGSLFAIR